MARKCKCKLCKKELTTDTAYRVVVNGKNNYYCSEDEYDNMIIEKNKKKNLMIYIACEVLQYEDGQIVPPALTKKLSKLNEFYSVEVIHETFRQKRDDIHYWMKNKDFSSEYGMISYIMKIIENNINDVYKVWKYKQQQLQKEKNNNTDVNMLNEVVEMKVNKSKKNSDISAFLDGDD